VGGPESHTASPQGAATSAALPVTQSTAEAATSAALPVTQSTAEAGASAALPVTYPTAEAGVSAALSTPEIRESTRVRLARWFRLRIVSRETAEEPGGSERRPPRPQEGHGRGPASSDSAAQMVPARDLDTGNVVQVNPTVGIAGARGFPGVRGLDRLRHFFRPSPAQVRREMVQQLLAGARTGNVGQVREALAYDAYLAEASDISGYQAIHLAARHNHLEVIRALHTANPNQFKALVTSRVEAPQAGRPEAALAPLHLAARAGHAEAVRLLLELGAEPNQPGPQAETAFRLAQRLGHQEVVRALQAGGAIGVEEDRIRTRYLMNMLDRPVVTPRPRPPQRVVPPTPGQQREVFVRLRDDMQDQQVRLMHFNLVAELGSGAYGTVYLANFEDREVAVKHINARRGIQDKRLRAEKEAMTRSAYSPYIVQLFRVVPGQNGQRDVAFVMEYCDGGSLKQLMRRHPVSRNSIKRLGAEILLGLECLHCQGIIHRDLKPDNIFLNNDGHVKIGDFGLARVPGVAGFEDEHFSPLGTPTHMAPEVWGKSQQSTAMDLWGLGIILYELLAGRLPFRPGDGCHPTCRRSQLTGTSLAAWGCAIPCGALRCPTDMTGQWWETVSSLLQKDPARRGGNGSTAAVRRLPAFEGVEWDAMVVPEPGMATWQPQPRAQGPAPALVLPPAPVRGPPPRALPRDLMFNQQRRARSAEGRRTPRGQR